MEQVPGSFCGRICYLEQVPWAVAGARDFAVAGPVTLQGIAAVKSLAKSRARNIIIEDIYIYT